MKTKKFFAMIAAVVALFSAVSCSPEDDFLMEGALQGSEKPVAPVDADWYLADAIRKDCVFVKDSTHVNEPNDSEISVLMSGLKYFELAIDGTMADKNHVEEEKDTTFSRGYNVKLAATVANYKVVLMDEGMTLPDSVEMKDGKFSVCNTEMPVSILPVEEVSFTVNGGAKGEIPFTFSTEAESADYRLETSKITRGYILFGKQGAAMTRAAVENSSKSAEIHFVCEDGLDLVYRYTAIISTSLEEKEVITTEFVDITSDGYVKYDVVRTKLPEGTVTRYPGQVPVNAELIAQAIESSIQTTAGISLTSADELEYTNARNYQFSFNKFNSLVNASYVNSVEVEFEGKNYTVVIPGSVWVSFADASEPTVDSNSNENYTLYTYTLGYNLTWKNNEIARPFMTATTSFTEMIEKVNDEVEGIDLTIKENGNNTVTLEVIEHHTVNGDVVVATWTVPAGLSVSCTPEFNIEDANLMLTGGSVSTVANWTSQGTESLNNEVSATKIAKTFAASFNHGVDRDVTVSQYETYTVNYNGESYSASVSRANLAQPAIKLTSEVDNNEKSEKTWTVSYSASTEKNSASATQKWVVTSEKSNDIVDRLVGNEVITLEGNNFFRNVNVTPVYSVTGKGNAYTAKINTNFSVTDNGTIVVYGDLGNLSLSSENIANVSAIRNDSIEGSRTKTTAVYSINDKFPSLYIEIDGVASLYGTRLMTLVPTTNATINATGENFKDGLYTVNVYNIVYTITVDGKSVNHTQRLENYVLNLDNTISGLEVDPNRIGSFARTEVYNNARSTKSQIDAGIFQEIANPSVKHFVAFDVASGAVLVNTVVSASELSVLDSKNGYCSLLKLDNQKPAVLYGNLSGNNYKQGFEYKALADGELNTFSDASITLERYSNPLIDTLVSQGAYYQMGSDTIYK